MKVLFSYFHKNALLIIGLVSIFLLALGLRIYKLETVPMGTTVDEANFGYIAYSLIKTGKDEHGISFPLIFKAFGDQKLPLQAYLLMPSVAIFGLNNFATRLPSAIFGSLSVLLIYALARNFKISKYTSLALAFFWAVSPITFILSRFAFESNIALTFFLLGLIALTKVNQMKKNSKYCQYFWLFTWVVSWALAWYGYIPYRFVIMAIFFFLAGYWWLTKKSLRIKLVLAFLGFSLLIMPSFILTKTDTNLARFKQIGIISDLGVSLKINENRTFCEHNGNLPKYLCYFFWNKPVVILQTIINRFLDVYSPNYLFIKGESEKYLSVDDSGQLNIFLIIPLILSIIVLSQKNWPQIYRRSEGELILILGLLLAPLPAILVGDPQKVRLSPLIPFLFILLGYGFDFLWSLFIKINLKKSWEKLVFSLIKLLVLSMLIFSIGQYFINFFTIHIEKNDWCFNSYAYNISKYLAENNLEKKPVFLNVDYPDSLMFYAYYSQYDPKEYQENIILSELEESGFQHAIELENLKVSSDSLAGIIDNFPNLVNGFYVTTDKNNLGVNFNEKEWLEAGVVAKIVKSKNGAMFYAWIIDLENYLNLISFNKISNLIDSE